MLRVADHFERTDTGRQRRANEDSYFARAPLFAVADGMGGAQAGEVASGLAVEVLEQGLPDGQGSVEERLASRVAEANARINELSRSSEDRAGMGTTLTAAYVGEHDLTVVHVGDSRLYRLREGEFERLTDDHSLVEELVRQGKLTPQEADEHPQRSIITRALGPEAGVEADRQTFPARDGDVYLLCSDGLTSMVPEARVAEVVREARSLSDAGRALVDAANAAGGRDNITVVLFRLQEVVPATVTSAEGRSLRRPEDETAVSEGRSLRRPEDETAVSEGRSLRRPEDETAVSAGRSLRRPEDETAVSEGRGLVRPADADPSVSVAPRAPRSPRAGAGAVASPRRRRRPRVPVGLIAATVIVAGLVAAFWFASQTVYFVGSSNDGFVTVYRGLPYDLPAGVTLYHVNYESSVPTATLPPRQKQAVTAHKLRSRDDAQDLVRKLETGQVLS